MMKQKIERFIEKHDKWEKELEVLRNIFNKTELVEDYKWASPTYTLNQKNIASFNAFKKHFCIWFFQGVYLKDIHKRLFSGSEKTKAMRQMRFESMQDIDEHIILTYLEEAINNEKLGKRLTTSKSLEYSLSEDLKAALECTENLLQAFNQLSPSKQKEYSNYINQGIQQKTKNKRIEKIKPMILAKVGLYEKYKKS